MYRHTRPFLQMLPFNMGVNMQALAAVIAKYLDMSEDALLSTTREFFPLTATESIEQWEWELGISEPAQNLAERRIDIYIKHKAEALSTPFDITSIAIGADLKITFIREFPFLAGISVVGDSVWPDEYRMRFDIEIVSDTTIEVIQLFRRRVARFIPATISGGVIYKNSYYTWR